jgi:hypothetical protein
MLSLMFTCGYSSANAKDKTAERHIRVAAIAIVEGLSAPCITAANGSLIECSLNTRTLSEAQKIKAPDGVIHVYADKMDASKNPPAKPMQIINLGSATNIILIFIPTERNYKIMQIQDNAVPFGAIGLINGTTSKIIYKKGTEQSTLLKSGMLGIIKCQNNDGFEMMISAQNDEGKMKLIRNTIWQISNEQREFVFIYGAAPDAKFHHIVDFKKDIN